MLLGQHSLVKYPDDEYVGVPLAIIRTMTSTSVAAVDPARSVMRELRSHLGMGGKQVERFLYPRHVGCRLCIAERGDAISHD